MKQLKIKDNSKNNKDKFSVIKSLTEKIADKTLEQLEKEGVFIFPELLKNSEDITKDEFILKSVNDSFYTSNIMGYLGYKDERLVIESRFSKCNKDYFFRYLIEKVLEIPNFIDLNTSMNEENSFINLFLFLFPHYLKLAMRKGIFKTYIIKKYNDNNVKGTIDIARHIQKNTPFIGNIAYNQHQFSYDNYLTELIRHTIEFIKKKPYGNVLLRKAKDEVDIIVSLTNDYNPCDCNKIIIENTKRTIRHAYYHEYRILQNLCLSILQNKKHEIGSGAKQIHGILFDGAWLWEEYVNSLVKKLFYHPMNKGRKGSQQLFSSDNGKEGVVYPDFISRSSDYRIIADAKYKPINNIGNKDYLQLLAYMFRFEAKKGIYFYPETQEDNIFKLRLNKGISYEKNVEARDDVLIIKQGILILNEAETYAQYIEKMKINEQIFIDSVLEKIM